MPASRSATRRSALAIGLAFGAGRALPVICLAPFAGGDRGGAVTAAMCERPGDPARAAPRRRRRARPRARSRSEPRERAGPHARAAPRELFAGSAYDPTAAGGLIAWQRPDGAALLLRGGADGLPGSASRRSAAGRIAWRDGDAIVVADAATLEPRDATRRPAPGVLALSGTLLAWRTRDAAGTDRIWAVAPAGAPRAVPRRCPLPTSWAGRRCSATGCCATSPGRPAAA